MLSEVADGVWVRESAWVWSNAVVVRADDGLVLVDPGIDGDELRRAARTTWMRSCLPVVAGFATHLHWDHLLWHPRFGDVPRYATGRLRAGGRWGARAGAADGGGERVGDRPRAGRARAPRCPRTAARCRARSVEHEAEATGHAAVLLADRGVLLAGDMLSDVLSPSSTRAAPVRWAPT